MNRDKKDPKKILVVTLSNLGDVILTLPVFSNLMDAYPAADLHVIAGPGAKDVFAGDPRIQKVIPYNKKISWKEKISFLASVRREKYDLIIDLRKSLIGILGGARARNSYLNFLRKRTHKTLQHLSALKGICRYSPDKKPFLAARNAGGPGPAKDFSGKTIVAAVGSKSDIKKWPAEHYAKLLDRFAILEGCRIVFIGDKNDAVDTEKVKQRMRSPSQDLSGQTDFGALCAVIQEAAMVITNDSAPLHIADHFKVPVLAIFGPTDPRKYGPRGENGFFIRKELFCSPCEAAQCRYRHECLKELGVDEVYKKAKNILEDEVRPKNFKILLVRMDRIGDLLLSFPAIAAVRKEFPHAHLSLMVRSYTEEIAQSCPWVDEVIPYRYEKEGRHRSLLGYFRFCREIIKRKFDVAFILHPSVRSHLLPALCGIPYRVGFDSFLPFLLTTKVRDRRHEGFRHEAETTFDLVKAFQPRAFFEKRFELDIFPEDERSVEALLEKSGISKEDRLIAFHPGASCVSKRWPKERFLELGKKILENSKKSVVVIGGPEVSPAGDFLQKGLGGRAFDLTGRLSLKETAALLRKCEVLVSNDSGPVHIAAAAGTRTFTVFGRNQSGLSAVRWKALGERHSFVQKDVGCVVCLAHECTIDFECLKAIQVPDVFDRLKKMEVL